MVDATVFRVRRGSGVGLRGYQRAHLIAASSAMRAQGTPLASAPSAPAASGPTCLAAGAGQGAGLGWVAPPSDVSVATASRSPAGACAAAGFAPNPVRAPAGGPLACERWHGCAVPSAARLTAADFGLGPWLGGGMQRLSCGLLGAPAGLQYAVTVLLPQPKSQAQRCIMHTKYDCLKVAAVRTGKVKGSKTRAAAAVSGMHAGNAPVAGPRARCWSLCSFSRGTATLLMRLSPCGLMQSVCSPAWQLC